MKVQIKNERGGGYGTTLCVDGKEVPMLRRVTLDHQAGETARVVAEIIAANDFDLDYCDADVTFVLEAVHGYEIQRREAEDGSERYTCRATKSDARCHTCRYWRLEGGRVGWGLCGATASLGIHTQWGEDAIETAPWFACVAWEEKEGAE